MDKRIGLFSFIISIIFSTSINAEVIHDHVSYSGGTYNWYAGDNPHIIIGYVSVNHDAVLEIEEGCIVKCENGAYVRIYGHLTATGSSREGIIFTRRDSEDQWSGINFQSGSSGSLHYCTIEYATYFTSYGIFCNNSTPAIENCLIHNNDCGIYYTGCTSPSLSVNNTIQNNDIGLCFINCTDPSVSNQTITGHDDPKGAIYMDNTGEFHIGAGNTVTDNTWGLSMNIGSYPGISSAGNIPTAGNTNEDGIQVYGGNTLNNVFWHDVGEDYIVSFYPTINNSGSLIIEDNVTVRFENNQYISVYGSLEANGTSGRSGILFTRRHSDDEWNGLKFQSGSSGSLHYCTIEYATYFTSYGIYCNNSTPAIENCLIHNNDCGIFYTGCISPSLYVNNTIQNNDIGLYFINCTDPSVSNQTITGHDDPKGAIYMDNTGEFHIGAGNAVTDNTWGLSMNIGSYPGISSAGNIPTAGNTNEDGIQVYGGNTLNNVFWHDVGEDYIVSFYPTINNSGSLIIEDNVTIRFENNQYISIYGSLEANGTSGRSGILFTRRHSDDEWNGLNFQSGSSGNLHYCTIEYATYFTSYGIFANTPTSFELDHCLLQNNDYGFYGIDASPVFTMNNQIINNSLYGIYLTGNCTPVFGSQLAEWNDIHGNTEQDFRNGDNDITTGYVYWGTEIYSEIEDHIYHEVDCDTLGFVNYYPYTNATHDIEFGEPFFGPLHVIIRVEDDTVHISWDPVVDAVSYKVSSSDDPYTGFSEDTSGIFVAESWSTPVINMKKYYKITAIKE